MLNLLQQVQEFCLKQQITLTPQHELVLQIIANSKIALSSNEILSHLIKYNPKANRMTIHRALESLLKYNLIHKIQVNQTYSLCQHLSDHSCQLFVCLNCGKQIEIHSHVICQALKQASNEYDFILENPLEITGYCKFCNQNNNIQQN